MKKWSLIKQLWFSTILMLTISTCVGLFGYYQASSLFSQLDQISTISMPAISAMTETDMVHDTIRANVFVAFYSKLQNNNGAFEEANKKNIQSLELIKNNLDTLNTLPISELSKKLISEAKPDLIKYMAASTEIMTDLTQNQIKLASTKMEDFNKAFTDLEVRLAALGEQVERESKLQSTSGSKTLALMAIFSVLGVLLSLSVGFFITARVRSNLTSYMTSLDNASQSVQSIAQRLSASNVQLSANATETASSLEETVASLEELSSMINLNSDNSQKTYNLSQNTKSIAESGEVNIKNLTAAISQIKNDSRKMEEIVNVIDDISFQTNLLALNAAVEAARAGEQGKGFAVVADAVRSLAQRSSTSAKEINQMIKESISKVENSSHLAHQCNDSLNEIVEHVKQVTDLSSQIASASQEQSTGLKQINQAMIQLDSASQDNASAAESLSAASTDADLESSKMATIVAKMNEFVFGSSTHFVATSQTTIQTNNVKNFKSKKQMSALKTKSIDLGLEPKDNKIKKVENF